MSLSAQQATTTKGGPEKASRGGCVPGRRRARRLRLHGSRSGEFPGTGNPGAALPDPRAAQPSPSTSAAAFPAASARFLSQRAFCARQRAVARAAPGTPGAPARLHVQVGHRADHLEPEYAAVFRARRCTQRRPGRFSSASCTAPMPPSSRISSASRRPICRVSPTCAESTTCCSSKIARTRSSVSRPGAVWVASATTRSPAR